MSIQTLRLSGLLSFAPDSAPLDLRNLNVLIGPNGSGKSNLIEAIELLAAMPRDLAATIRDGGGPSEWLWKGDHRGPAEVDAVLKGAPTGRPLRYRIEFDAVQNRVEVTDEAVEEVNPKPGMPPGSDVFFYYRFQHGHPVINVADGPRHLQRENLRPDQSVLAQRKDPDLYPEVTWVGERLGAFHTFREWSFGRFVALRQPQPADLPEDRLLADSRNLALVLNQIEHDRGGERLNDLMRRFYPRFERLSTRISGGTVQFYLHEQGFGAPIPATRLSDGTIRFIALTAALLARDPPPLLCIEEPELGLHPDALPLLSELLVEASARTQLIVTTHSDALVSALTDHVEAVVACERLGNGTVLRRLDPAQLAAWLDEYRLGDLWRTGETSPPVRRRPQHQRRCALAADRRHSSAAANTAPVTAFATDAARAQKTRWLTFLTHQIPKHRSHLAGLMPTIHIILKVCKSVSVKLVAAMMNFGNHPRL